MSAGADLWSQFPLDPRERAHAGLRASDEDRERVTGELTAAFADGRLAREELDERMDAVTSARTLGDLPPLVHDLVPAKPPVVRSSKSLVGVPHAELQRRAEDEWRQRRRAAVFSFLATTVVLTGVAYAWEAWVLVFALLPLLNVVRVAGNHEVMVRDRVRALEKKQARQQRWPKSLS